MAFQLFLLPESRRTLGHSKIRIGEPGAQAEVLGQLPGDGGALAHPTDEQADVHVVDPALPGPGEHRTGQVERALQQRRRDLFEVGAGDSHARTPAGVDHQHVHAVTARQRQLRLLRRGQQLLLVIDVVQGVADVGLRLGELLREKAHQFGVPVGASQFVVTVSGNDRDRVLRQPDDRSVEGATTEVVDQHGGVRRAVLGETIGKGGGGRFVDDVDDVQPGQRPGEFRRLALLVTEVGGNGDDHVGHRASGHPLRVGGQGLENKTGHRGSAVLLTVDDEPPVRFTHMPLDQARHVVWTDP